MLCSEVCVSMSLTSPFRNFSWVPQLRQGEEPEAPSPVWLDRGPTPIFPLPTHDALYPRFHPPTQRSREAPEARPARKNLTEKVLRLRVGRQRSDRKSGS